LPRPLDHALELDASLTNFMTLPNRLSHGQ
jgi:hypothetical protein